MSDYEVTLVNDNSKLYSRDLEIRPWRLIFLFYYLVSVVFPFRHSLDTGEIDI